MSTRTDSSTLEFHDFESSDKAVAVVRRLGERVTLALSIRSNGDIDVFLDKENGTGTCQGASRCV